jgi:type I restriction enzyme S subunit
LRALSDVNVGDLFESIRILWYPNATPGLAVRNYDLTDALDPFLDPLKPTSSPDEILSTKKQIAAGDLVVSRLRSYLREIAIVLPGDEVTTVASTEFIVLRPKEGTTLTVEALLIYLRSRLPQIVFKWSQDGSNHPRFDERELLNLPVPRALIDSSATYQVVVSEMVSQRQRASLLLGATKRAVEIAIEESESAAVGYLDAAFTSESQ